MNCGFFERWLMASADNELAGWRAAWLRSHLAGCPKCAQGLAELRRLREAIASRKQDYAATGQDAPFFWQRLRAAMQSFPQEAPHTGVVMAYSTRTRVGEPTDKPTGVALFGKFPVRRLAFAAVAAAVVVAA
ncbi:MAG: zf-HC2 domain-containing protein, partial [Verrucomicrobia bacterium]|nr:zf-HC2 domain-containing protein [Verrucomicrobiota bacterium]